MVAEQKNVSRVKDVKLLKKLEDKEYRDAFVSSRLRIFLSGQIQKLRGQLSQIEFGRIIDKPQSVISRLENSSSGQLSVQTLLDIASKLDIALVVRFASFPDFLTVTSDFSNEAEKPNPYNQKEIEELTKPKLETSYKINDDAQNRQILFNVRPVTKPSRYLVPHNPRQSAAGRH